ncbi:hypothetical protein [Roseibium polysiphoniae]
MTDVDRNEGETWPNHGSNPKKPQQVRLWFRLLPEGHKSAEQGDQRGA